MGVSAYFTEGTEQVIASYGTFEMIEERGERDTKSEIERFPHLFAGAETVPGLTWSTLVFDREITRTLVTWKHGSCIWARGIRRATR